MDNIVKALRLNPAEILNDLAVGICITDSTGKFVAVNKEYCRIYAYKKDELLGSAFTKVVSPKDQAFAQKLHDDFIAGLAEDVGEWVVLDKNNHSLNIEARASRTNDEQGRLYKVTAVIDTSERKTIEEALRKNKRELNKAQSLAKLGNWSWDIVLSRPGNFGGSFM